MLEGMRAFVDAARAPLLEIQTPLERLRALFRGHLAALHSGGDEQAVVAQEWDKIPARTHARG